MRWRVAAGLAVVVALGGIAAVVLRDDEQPAACEVLERDVRVGVPADGVRTGSVAEVFAGALARESETTITVYLDPASDEGTLREIAAVVQTAGLSIDRLLDRDAAFKEFRLLFVDDSPELVASITADVLPMSVVASGDPDTADDTADALRTRSDVHEVVIGPLEARLVAAQLGGPLRELLGLEPAAADPAHELLDWPDDIDLVVAAARELVAYAEDECGMRL